MICVNVVAGLIFSAAVCWNDVNETTVVRDGSSEIRLSLLGRYTSGIYKQSAAEIVAYEPERHGRFVFRSGFAKSRRPRPPLAIGCQRSQRHDRDLCHRQHHGSQRALTAA
ncbi:MAG: hypothetical protein Q8M16_04120 [Pirellulaceae bacterium]|nr:hypothetical protein [Pirellulaceae bacterium]